MEAAELTTEAIPEEDFEHPDDYPDVEWCARCEIEVAIEGDEHCLCAYCSPDY